MSKLTCVAHRGGPLINNQYFPENSLAAIRRALDSGVDAIEIDIYQVQGELLVTHDRRLGRVITGQGIITDVSLAYLNQQTLENGEPIPRLQDVLNLVANHATVNIEIKGADCVDALKDCLDTVVVERGGSYEGFIVSSFDHQQLFRCMQVLPHVRRGVLIEGIPLDYAKCCEALKAYSFNTHLGFISPELLTDARRRGLKNWVYTANHEEDWRKLEAMGVDGIFTDKPDALSRFLLA